VTARDRRSELSETADALDRPLIITFQVDRLGSAADRQRMALESQVCFDVRDKRHGHWNSGLLRT